MSAVPGSWGSMGARRGSECPKNFFAHYMILRVYTVMHNNTSGLPTIMQKEKVAGGGGGGTDMAVSVARACK